MSDDGGRFTAAQVVFMNRTAEAAQRYFSERNKWPPAVYLSQALYWALFPGDAVVRLVHTTKEPVKLFLRNIEKTMELRIADVSLGDGFNIVGDDQDYEDSIVEHHLLLNSQPDTDSNDD